MAAPDPPMNNKEGDGEQVVAAAAGPSSPEGARMVQSFLNTDSEEDRLLYGVWLGYILCACAIVVWFVCAGYMSNWHDTSGYVIDGQPFPESVLLAMSSFGTSVILSIFCFAWTAEKKNARLFVFPIVINSLSFLCYLQLYAGHAPFLLSFNNKRLIPSRYLTWLITTPLMLYLYSLVSRVPTGELLRNIALDVVMLVTGFFASKCPAPQNAAFLCASIVAFCFVVMFIHKMINMAIQECSPDDEEYIRALRWAKAFMLLGWIAMPMVWTFAALNMIDVTTEELLYEIADLLSKSGTSAMLLHSSLQTNAERVFERTEKLIEHERLNAMYWLQESGTKRERWISAVSSHLSAPLIGIMGLCDDVLNAGGGMPEEDFQANMDAVTVAARVLVEMLQEAETEPTTAQVSKTVREIEIKNVLLHVTVLSKHIIAPHVAFVIDVEDDVPEVLASPRYLHQSLSAVLAYCAKRTHAIVDPGKAGHSEPQVTIQCFAKSDLSAVIIRVTETSDSDWPGEEGMEMLAEMFDKPYGGLNHAVEVPSAPKTNDGTLQALSSVRMMIAAQGGKVSAQVSSGRTCFNISLPTMAL
eukprot:CAMPEP_0206271434 /NCGR_PEP_ID=MMETSP0047_2-20121206/33432_1 /ASSEMBLY_ACC=CAM_ASM_000192 /TAXON_ID=195065 /ORGANISM="Chroomonas mesostigmatica_cf, Strain CCMP1168" /LENGTH=583 /DNA_ID=CAMNT_0053700207 /DNA_START=91 /DNA_END=1843 /DNA_ORIENTATION=-